MKTKKNSRQVRKKAAEKLKAGFQVLNISQSPVHPSLRTGKIRNSCNNTWPFSSASGPVRTAAKRPVMLFSDFYLAKPVSYIFTFMGYFVLVFHLKSQQNPIYLTFECS